MNSMKVFLQTFGCQMNKLDSAIIETAMKEGGYQFVNNSKDADIVLINTCSVREHAERRVISNLGHLKYQKETRPGLVVGVIGCMAQRMGEELIKHPAVDIVCGPDAYRSLPHLLAIAGSASDERVGIANVMLSVDETYADIIPLRMDESKVGAWVSIMRGCNNMCSFCVVPFTRGRRFARNVVLIP